MTAVLTDNDLRFGDPAAVPTPWDVATDQFRDAGVSWITTVRADGRPHVVPLVAVWADDRLNFCTGEGEQKEVNLRANPHVALTTGTNSWDSGLDVVIEGTAVAVTATDQLVRLAEVWTTVWDGRWRYEIGDGCFHHPGAPERVLVFAVEPDKGFAFAKGEPFCQTRYRFTTEFT